MLLGSLSSVPAVLRRGLVILTILFLAQISPAGAQQFRAAWADVFHVGMGSTAEVETMLNSLTNGHYNVLIVQVLAYMDSTTSSSHGAHWKSSILPWSTRVTGSFDPLTYVCAQAHARGIQVHAWLGGSGGGPYRVSQVWPPNGNATLSAHPEWFMVPRSNSEANASAKLNGNYLLDMGSPDAQEYLIGIVRELVTNYPIDGINWDDEIDGSGYYGGMGFPAYSQANYARSGLARYRTNTGYVGTPAFDDRAYADYRRRFKNEFMARAQAEIQSIKSNPRQPLWHTIAPLAYGLTPPATCDFSTSTPYLYYCDWAAMLQNGWVDAAVPQIYRAESPNAASFRAWCDRSYACWQYQRKIFVGLGAYLNPKSGTAAQLNYVYYGQAGGNGFNGASTYSYAVPSNDSGDWWGYAAANIYTNTATVPTMPWRDPTTATNGLVWGRVVDYNTGLYVDDATVTMTDGPTVKTDANGYYVATLVPATAGGTAHSITASKSGSGSQTITDATVLAGDIVRYDLTLNAPGAPIITRQPQSQSVDQGADATFDVSASGAAPLYYQWRFNTTNLAGATSSSYTRSNAQPAHAGSYSVIVSNSVGATNSAEAILSLNQPPSITTQPQSQAVNQGGGAVLTVAAAGAAPLAFQWTFFGTNLPGATAASLPLNNVATNQSGPYRAVVSNTYGAATSQVATLTVATSFHVGGVSLAWNLAPGSRSYLTSASLPNERGMAYNPVGNHLLLVSRSGPHVYVLNAATGADLNELSVSGLSGGTYPLLMIGVAEDGVVYAGNLTTAGSATPFTLYRWANDSAGTLPTVAFTGDPSPGNNQRWGDTLDVRGAGADTQVILGSRHSTNACLLTTINGVNFTAKSIDVADAPADTFGLGIAFGAGATFWGKATSLPLRQVAFNSAAGTGSTLRSYADPIIPDTVGPIGISTSVNLLGAINVGVTGNHFRLYDLAAVATNGSPALLATTPFATDNENSMTGTGAVDFGPAQGYALGANNGLIALQLDPGSVAPSIVGQPSDLASNAGGTADFSGIASGWPEPAYQWRFNGTNIGGATGTSYSRSALQPADAGSYSVVASNVAGTATSRVAVLTVNVPPAIGSQPQSRTNMAGTDASFSVGASGTAPLRYQWRRNGGSITGATESAYTRPAVQVSDAGSYTVLVTNVAGLITSAEAVLSVLLNPPHIDAISLLPEGRVQLLVSGSPGSYAILAASNFDAWSELTNFTTTNSSFQYTDGETNLTERYYRARLMLP